MNDDERDELLYRISERTQNIYHLTEKLERHNALQNDHIFSQGKQVESNRTSIGRLWWLISIVVTGSGGTAGVTKLLGLW